MPRISTTAEISFECKVARLSAEKYRARVVESMSELAKHCADSRALIAQSRAMIAQMDASFPPK
jgi:hypothetical protein